MKTTLVYCLLIAIMSITPLSRVFSQNTNNCFDSTETYKIHKVIIELQGCEEERDNLMQLLDSKDYSFSIIEKQEQDCQLQKNILNKDIVLYKGIIEEKDKQLNSLNKKLIFTKLIRNVSVVVSGVILVAYVLK